MNPLLNLEELLKAIDEQDLSVPPAQTLKKLDSQDSIIYILSFRLQKMYRLLLQYEYEVEEFVDRLTDHVSLHYEEPVSKDPCKENFAKFDLFISQRLKEECSKIRQYQLIKIIFDVEIENILGIRQRKFMGIRDGAFVVYRYDNGCGDQSRAEKLFFTKGQISSVSDLLNREFFVEIVFLKINSAPNANN